MEQYIGTKIIKAIPMIASEAVDKDYKIGQALPDTPGYEVEYGDGYRSWSPWGEFEKAYRKTSGMPFGLAIEALKKGLKVCRSGWNGKGMWLSLSHAEPRGIHSSSFWSANNKKFASDQPGECAEVVPCITMKTADNKILMGWLASQTDMLADDWMIVE